MIAAATPQDALELAVDKALYGNCFIGPDGKRVDPRSVVIEPGSIESVQEDANGLFIKARGRIVPVPWDGS